MNNILVFGASGQLGQCIKAVTTVNEVNEVNNIFFPDEAEANILDTDALGLLFNKYKPIYVINCAAYTAVDKAEDDKELAYKINVTGAQNLAELCKQHNSTLIHISTDFVFKGDKATPRTETDEASPISVYGQTKLDGEIAVARVLNQNFIIRTGWLYSEYANNFVKTMLRLGKERDQLGVIVDQAGSPTYAIDLAGVIFDIIESGNDTYGIYHYSNEGVTSWYDFAKTIFAISNTSVKVNPVKTSEYVTKAVRPAYSVMDKSKIKKTFGIEIPYWRDSLEVCLGRL